ncbi:MAG: NERD domain-containing protein [Methylophagaceae bacterium]
MIIDTQAGIIIAAIFILIVILVLFSIRNKRQRMSLNQISTILKSQTHGEIKDFIIPDGIGGLLEIEHLLLLDQGLLLIESYPMAGNLFGSETIDQWTQILDGRSFKFANPLRHIRTSRQAIKLLAPNVPIFCRVIFTSDSIFPKGKPDEVSILSSLAEDLEIIHAEAVIVEKAQQGWQRIMRIARKDGQAVKRGAGLDGR